MPDGSEGLGFPSFLTELAMWAVNGAVTVSTVPSRTVADYTVFVGGPVSEFDLQHSRPLVVAGDGWRSWIGNTRQSPVSVSPTSTNPLGPFLAAALAAGEIFKYSRGIRRGRFLTNIGLSLWSGTESPVWEALEDGPSVAGVTLPPIHLVGAGAVGNALAYVLANLGLRDGYVIPVDDDSYDATNLNRCPLAGWADLSHPKVAAIKRALVAAGLDVYPFEGTLSSYIADERPGLRGDVAQHVADLRFGIAVSCVDKGKSRQDVQGLRPGLLLGGSTLDLQARSNFYSGLAGAACLGCYNPAERDGEKIRALESRLRIMPADERRQFLAGHGIDVLAVEEYLAHPQCGGLGEAAVRDLATRTPSEFSVGFVSLAAGVLVATALLQNSVFSSIKPKRGDMVTLNFLNGRLGDGQLAADPACELKCQGRFSSTPV
jgi:hypothetical protein